MRASLLAWLRASERADVVARSQTMILFQLANEYQPTVFEIPPTSSVSILVAADGILFAIIIAVHDDYSLVCVYVHSIEFTRNS